MDDWYNISVKEIHKNGGGGLLSAYYPPKLWKKFIQNIIGCYGDSKKLEMVIGVK